MKEFSTLPILLILLFGTPAFADFDKGLNACDTGNYATPLKECKPPCRNSLPI